MASLVIGNEVKPTEHPRNTFLFVVSRMSGDGDAYTEESFKIKTEAQAINFALLLDCIAENSSGEAETTEQMAMLINENLPEVVIQSVIGNSYLEDYIGDITGYDVMSDGQFIASLNGYYIFWFNEFGIKFEVSFVK